MIQKTYGIDNLVDWKAQINVGKAKVIVHFTGGAITRYGVTPAEYTTGDKMMQHIIENSEYYKSGRIKLLRVIETNPRDGQARDAGETAKAETQATGMAGSAKGEETGNMDNGVEEVAVSCLDDAKEYLLDKYGVRNIRTWSEAKKTAEEHGVVFKV